MNVELPEFTEELNSRWLPTDAKTKAIRRAWYHLKEAINAIENISDSDRPEPLTDVRNVLEKYVNRRRR